MVLRRIYGSIKNRETSLYCRRWRCGSTIDLLSLVFTLELKLTYSLVFTNGDSKHAKSSRGNPDVLLRIPRA
ncbi:predicted protein [Chaetoceros tenuissimus]|uniref:Uncharacterized protein n=1 Tax=Chaetoceros tenuissimus TaxID=426638 RepID=A0AAD3CM92_9STRA|nr:predicted protein [Chaetoceros tenuissimus]